jgi:hypothetical protein
MVSCLCLQDTCSTYDQAQMPDMQTTLSFRKTKGIHKSHEGPDFALVSHLNLKVQLLQIQVYC